MGYWMEAILMKLTYLLFAMNEAISPQWQQKKEKTNVNESETLLSYNVLNIIASYTSNDITVSTQDHRQVKQHNNTELKVRDHPRLCHYHYIIVLNPKRRYQELYNIEVERQQTNIASISTQDIVVSGINNSNYMLLMHINI